MGKGAVIYVSIAMLMASPLGALRDCPECEQEQSAEAQIWYYDDSSTEERYRPFELYIETDRPDPAPGRNHIQHLESDWEDELWPTPGN